MKRLRKKLRRFLCAPWMRPALAAGIVLVIGMPAYASGGGGELHVNWWSWDQHSPPVGWFIIDFIIFVALLVKFVGQPLKKTLKDRHETMQRAIDEAKREHELASAHYEEYKTKLAQVDKEVSSLIEASKKTGAKARDEIVDAAQQYAASLQKDSSTVIDHELFQSLRRLKDETATEALHRAEQALRAKLTDDDRQRLLEDSIKELEADTTASEAPRRGSAPRASAGGAA